MKNNIEENQTYENSKKTVSEPFKDDKKGKKLEIKSPFNKIKTITTSAKKIKERDAQITLAKFFIPWIIAVIGVAVLYVIMMAVYDYNTFKFLGVAMILYFFPPAGKESVIPAAVAGPDKLNDLLSRLPFDMGPMTGQDINPFIIAMSIAFIDIVVGLFFVWNFDIAKKIPILGRFITKLESKGEQILKKKPWVNRLAFTGIILFVMFPLQGSGAVGASIIGRALGMEPHKVWHAVIIGAISGCMVIAYSSTALISFINSVELFQIVILIAGIIIFITIGYVFRKWNIIPKVVKKNENKK